MNNLLPNLTKFLASSGVASRRKAAELIKEGAVTVNGTMITDPSHKIGPDDVVRYQDRIVKKLEHTYVLLNKPTGYITSKGDEHARHIVFDLLPKNLQTGLFPVGRLDRDTTGLLLITNDGDLALRLSHPRYSVAKVYCATLREALTPLDMEKLRKGVRLRDGFIKPDRIAIVARSRGYQVIVHLHSGKKHVVRRIFAHLEYHVTELDRVGYAGLSKRGLPCGQWRFLSSAEIDMLKNYHLRKPAQTAAPHRIKSNKTNKNINLGF